jgi:hypothetical protein
MLIPPPFAETAEPARPAQALRADENGLYLTAALFVVHLLLVGLAAPFDRLHAVMTAAAGWTMLLGFLVGMGVVCRISLDGRTALRVLGLASIPIVVRAAAYLLKLLPDPAAIPSSLYWIRPLDVFELAAGAILTFSLHRFSEAPVKKCIVAVLALALAWDLCGRGYFPPF